MAIPLTPALEVPNKKAPKAAREKLTVDISLKSIEQSTSIVSRNNVFLICLSK